MSSGQDDGAAERSAHVSRGGEDPSPTDSRPWRTLLVHDASGAIARMFHFRSDDIDGWSAEIRPHMLTWPAPLRPRKEEP